MIVGDWGRLPRRVARRGHDPRRSGRPRFVRVFATLLSAAGALVMATLAAAQPSDTSRVIISASPSVLMSTDGQVRALYGSARFGARLDFDVAVRSGFALFSGGQWSRANGRTRVESPGVFDEGYPITLSTWSFRAGGALVRKIGTRLRAFAGAGLAVGGYDERWPDLGSTSTGSSAGAVGVGGIHYAWTSRLGLVGRAEYSWLRAGNESARGGRPNLGGVELSAGVSARF